VNLATSVLAEIKSKAPDQNQISDFIKRSPKRAHQKSKRSPKDLQKDLKSSTLERFKESSTGPEVQKFKPEVQT
jgi:hypothetical protein